MVQKWVENWYKDGFKYGFKHVCKMGVNMFVHILSINIFVNMIVNTDVNMCVNMIVKTFFCVNIYVMGIKQDCNAWYLMVLMVLDGIGWYWMVLDWPIFSQYLVFWPIYAYISADIHVFQLIFGGY